MLIKLKASIFRLKRLLACIQFFLVSICFHFFFFLWRLIPGYTAEHHLILDEDFNLINYRFILNVLVFFRHATEYIIFNWRGLNLQTVWIRKCMKLPLQFTLRIISSLPDANDYSRNLHGAIFFLYLTIHILTFAFISNFQSIFRHVIWSVYIRIKKSEKNRIKNKYYTTRTGKTHTDTRSHMRLCRWASNRTLYQQKEKRKKAKISFLTHKKKLSINS